MKLSANSLLQSAGQTLYILFSAPRNRIYMITQLLSLEINEVDLLPFHRLGSGKYTVLGMKYPYEKIKPLTSEELDRIAGKYKEYFNVKIER